ncbi:HET domain containing protein [Hyaloscypha variabilis]
MHLLHSKTLELAEFTERGLPPYAILSHTWEDEEVSFQEMQSRNSTGKKGHAKIRKCCDIAAAAGFEYVWVDTCCIDKTSSAELTEAINSMYLWYQKADVCYVYMADYHGLTILGRPLPSFRDSRWFKRGWTLQELIAPECVIFYNSQWKNIGTKHSLKKEISEITDIQIEALLGAKLEDFSVAQRMCWASRRETTRIEDEAYSLQGIFDVHMPMLYGEGGHAFIRLQEEIIKRSTDHTIFAWAHGFPRTRSYTGGIFADSPSAFVNTKFIVQDLSTNILPFEITNKGVHLHLPIYEESFGVLDCQDMKKPKYNLAINLIRKDSSDTFHFSHFHGTVSVAKEERRDIPVRSSIYVPRGSSLKTLPAGFQAEQLEYYFDCSFIHTKIFFADCNPRNWSKLAESGSASVSRGAGLVLLPLDNTVGQDYGSITINDHPISAKHLTKVIFNTQSLLDSRFGQRNDTCQVSIRYFSATGHYAPACIFREGRDRIIWQHPLARWWLSIGISRVIISGRRAMLITIKDEPT